MEKFDCVVVGAGFYGLGAAKQYHSTHPDDALLIVESQSSLGGTWADTRLYPGLKSNNLLGTYEYPDFPMDTATFGVKPGEHIPGGVVNAYLKAYADHFGIADKVRLDTRVLVAEHQDRSPDGGWILTLADAGTEDDQKKETKVFARKLVVATGLTSEAFLPHFEGQETFGGRIFHGKQFQQNADTLKTAKSVTVFGATKFAWDAVYAYATAGVEVDWVIRSSGHGPCWMAPPYVTPLKKWIEKLANIRFLTWFSPCIFAEDGYPGIRRFLHGTAAGRGIVNTFWNVLGGDVMTLNAYDAHPETAKLKPWVPAMFAGTSFSILNYDTDFFDLVKNSGKIRIHVGEIVRLSPGMVHLADGTSFASDALLANTGWKHVPPMKFLPEGIERELGLPHADVDPSAAGVPPDDLANQRSLAEQADQEILSRFPRLRDQPVWNKDYVPLTEQRGIDSDDAVTPCAPLTPFMLHRFIVPASARLLRTRDVAFAGMVGNFSNVITAHLQGLWIAAYFAGKLARDPSAAAAGGDNSGDDETDAMRALRYNTVLQNRFGRWRYPVDWGTKAPSFIFDAVPYLDVLQRDLGLDPHRKRGFLAEVWSPYGPEDYRDLNDEWLAKYGGDKK